VVLPLDPFTLIALHALVIIHMLQAGVTPRPLQQRDSWPMHHWQFPNVTCNHCSSMISLTDGCTCWVLWVVLVVWWFAWLL